MKQKNAPIIDMNNSKNFYQNNSEFVKLMLANAIGRFGDSIDIVAFSWLTYQITNSAAWSAVVVGVNQLVSVVFQPIIGSVVESLNKKKVMVWADILRFLAILIFYITYRMRNADAIVLICFTAVVSLIETFRIPAGFSVIPKVLMKDDYDKGISINNSLSKCCELVGLVSAATLIGYLGADGAVFVDGLTYIVSGFLISTIKFNDDISTQNIRSNYLSMTKEGAKFLWTQKSLLIICVICGLINASVIPFDSLQSVYINIYFNARVQILSAVSIAISMGMMIGSALYRFIPSKYINTSILTIGGITLGLFYLTAFTITKIKIEIVGGTIGVRIVILVIASFSIGLMLAFMNNYVQIYFIKAVKQEFLSRISSISTTITTALSPITAFIIGLFATILETATIFLVWGLAVIISFVLLCSKLQKLTVQEQ